MVEDICMYIVQSLLPPVFSSHIFVNELSVDWPAWGSDEDLFDYLEPIDHSNGGTGFLEDIQRTLTTLNIKGVQESEISRV